MKDFLGREIREGDLVARAIYSSHTFHTVLKITEKGVTLSRGNSIREYQRYEWEINPETGIYQRTDRVQTYQYSVYGGASNPQGVNEHDGKIYVKKSNVSLVLI